MRGTNELLSICGDGEGVPIGVRRLDDSLSPQRRWRVSFEPKVFAVSDKDAGIGDALGLRHFRNRFLTFT